MPPIYDLEHWLREQCSEYVFSLIGVFEAKGHHDWPLVASDESDLVRRLVEGGHILPLPKEPASLANVLEVSIVDFLLLRIGELENAIATRGTERGYPDLEISGQAFGGGFHAVDIKVARRKATKRGFSKNTNSRVTLYTGNTYFRHPTLTWPGATRPFNDYASHLDVIGIYTLDEDSAARVRDLELIVQPPWKIASRQRSSTTREYIGAVTEIDALREGQGEFESPDAFYAYWRRYKFKVGDAVQQQLDKLLKGDADR
ncbi:hypothetical protein GCM10028777_18130 [Angustibacter speluncae]